MFLGKEQIHNPSLSLIEKIYVFIFGMPIVGLRIRCRNILSLIPTDRAYKKILDAGSGSGVLTFELARRFRNAQVTGYDLSSEEISVSKVIADKVGYQNVSFQNTNIETMDEERSFDLIVCVDILEHLEKDMEALVKLTSALTENGTLVLHVPALYRRYPVWEKRLNFDVPSHVRHGYILSDIQSKIENTGLHIVDMGYTYGFWETFANNISYMITGAQKKNKILYAFAFPVLNLISLLGRKARPEKLGAGVFIVAETIK